MKFRLLSTLSLAALLIPAAWARQQQSQQPQQQQLAVPAGTAPAAAAVAAPAPQPLTPRQKAEMRGDLLMVRKEFTEAIRVYKDLLKEDPRNAQLLNKIGVAYQQTLNLRDAEKYYKNAAKADKTFASPLNNIGTVEYERKHYGKSIKFYNRALKVRTDMATIYSNLGYAYFEDKKYPDAILSFRQALLLDPTVFENKSQGGAIVQQRSTTDPGLFYYYVAKCFALGGNAEQAAHFLKLARDDGYKDFVLAEKDPAFAKVIKDPRVQTVLTVVPSYAADQHKTSPD